MQRYFWFSFKIKKIVFHRKFFSFFVFVFFWESQTFSICFSFLKFVFCPRFSLYEKFIILWFTLKRNQLESEQKSYMNFIIKFSFLFLPKCFRKKISQNAFPSSLAFFTFFFPSNFTFSRNKILFGRYFVDL